MSSMKFYVTRKMDGALNQWSWPYSKSHVVSPGSLSSGHNTVKQASTAGQPRGASVSMAGGLRGRENRRGQTQALLA